MKTTDRENSHISELSVGPAPVDGQGAPTRVQTGKPTRTAASPSQSEANAPPTGGSPKARESQPQVAAPPSHRYRRWLWLAATVIAILLAGHFLVPLVETVLNTVSTDDAYVNGHLTFVAPRVSGEVTKVLVNDNMRVKKGDLLVQLDKEPFQVQVSLKRAAVHVAEANLAAAESKARSLQALAGSQRWKIQTASQGVKNQIALLKARAAALRTKQANLDRTRADYERGKRLVQSYAIATEELGQRQEQFRVAEAALIQAREEIFQVRASLGLVPELESGTDLTDVPPDLHETFSDVRSAFSELVQTMTQLGLPLASTDATPSKAIAEFQRLNEDGDLDQILRDLIPKVPAVLQAKAQLEQARHDLEQAELNLRYCNVVSEIDGVVTSRNVNPGNNLQAGQSIMAVRSITEIWIDANFKETQLADLRIGQRAATGQTSGILPKIPVEMYCALFFAGCVSRKLDLCRFIGEDHRCAVVRRVGPTRRSLPCYESW
jgi:membrane fusion protein (multidrug efflux system)